MNKENIVEAINNKLADIETLKAEVKELKAQLKVTDTEINKNLIKEGLTVVCKLGKTEEVMGVVKSIREKTFTIELADGKKLSRNFDSLIKIVDETVK